MPSNGTYRIAALPGDGTGPEVVREGLKVLAATGVKLDLAEFDLGGERYKKTGDILPDSVLEELRGFDAIYLGAIGRPDVPPGILEKGLLLRLRFQRFTEILVIKAVEEVYLNDAAVLCDGLEHVVSHVARRVDQRARR